MSWECAGRELGGHWQPITMAAHHTLAPTHHVICLPLVSVHHAIAIRIHGIELGHVCWVPFISLCTLRILCILCILVQYTYVCWVPLVPVIERPCLCFCCLKVTQITSGLHF